MKNWPRLSETLPHAAHPKLCGNCGVHDDTKLVHVWIEHDVNDRPERRFVALCDACSDKIIEPHPRLYARMDENAPLPGVMDLCVDCKHRSGLNCSSPLAKFNGGDGISITADKPMVYHMDGRDKKGRRWSRWGQSYSNPPKACTGKETQ